MLENKKISLVINTSSGYKSITDSQSIRRTALNNNIPYFTTVSGAIACTEAIEAIAKKKMGVLPIQNI